LTELSLCYSIVYHYDAAQCYEQLLQPTGRLTVSGFDLACPLTSTWPRLVCDVGLEEGEY